MIHIYNTLSRQKEPLKTIEPGKVKLYVCGVTVYDYCHIGHARTYVTFDMIVRYLRASGYMVTYVRNITDIDDKIIKRAAEQRRDMSSLTEEFIQAMREDFAALNILPPDAEPRATAHIPQIIAMVQALIQEGYAYVAENGDVYYRVRKFQPYGLLSQKAIDDLRSGARVEVEEIKEDPLDFVLWKRAKAGEPQWDSPWGPGRPGWHIECSAMSTHCLGNHFDVHGGGNDLIFPHHENEIAQAEAATQEKFVNTWMHVGFVQVNKEKMSKSLGNFFTIREVLKNYPAEAIRYFMITSHYRSPVNYSQENLDIAYSSLERLYTALWNLPQAEAVKGSEFESQFYAAMNDDFNTPEALVVLFEIAHEINRQKSADAAQAAALGALLRKLGNMLGIFHERPEEFLRQGVSDAQHRQIETLIAERTQARSEKNWCRADEIRDQLTRMGVALEDTAAGTSWRKA